MHENQKLPQCTWIARPCRKQLCRCDPPIGGGTKVRVKSAMTLIGFVLALGTAEPCLAQWTSVHFTVVAHEDDWQLFFNPVPWTDVRTPGRKVVFIYLTAGDAGLGTGPAASPYLLAREEGAERAVRFIANIDSVPGSDAFTKVVVNGHTISKHTYKNTPSYFLRLPDGNPHGKGYPETGQISLEKLRLGQLPALSAVDGSATYVDWNDLVYTLEVLIRTELLGSGAARSSLLFHDSSPTANPHDHSDHTNAGRAMDIVASRMPCMDVTRFVGYDTGHLLANVSPADLINKAGVFAVTVSGVTDRGHGTRWIKSYLHWLERTYSHTIQGNGSRCYNAGKPCGQSTCGGCCDVDGVCQDGTTHAACGYGGSSCAVCSLADGMSCRNQVCAAHGSERTTVRGAPRPKRGPLLPRATKGTSLPLRPSQTW